jgi:xanthine dehydrogenase large subunit
LFSTSAAGTSNITVGEDIDTALANSYRRVAGHISAGGQYHFYMEAQTAVACSVDGDNITVTCGAQYASAYQATIATVLGVPLNKVSGEGKYL